MIKSHVSLSRIKIRHGYDFLLHFLHELLMSFLSYIQSMSSKKEKHQLSHIKRTVVNIFKTNLALFSENVTSLVSSSNSSPPTALRVK